MLYEPALSLGIIGLNEPKTFDVPFRNEKLQKVRIDLQAPDLESQATTLNPGCTHVFTFSFTPAKSEVWRREIQVRLDGVLQLKPIDVIATIYNQKHYLMDVHMQIVTFIDMGNFYMGQRKVLDYKLLNDTAQVKKFKISIVQGLHNNDGK